MQLGLTRPSQTSSIVGFVLPASSATKTDPNALEQSVPTFVNNLWRITLKNPAVVGTTPDQALTYTVRLKDLQGVNVTLDWTDMFDFLLVAGEAPPTDVRIMIGVSEGGAPSAARRGIASALAYSSGNWQAQYTANVNGSSWSSWTAAAATSASTMMVKMNAQVGSTGTQGQHGTAILDSAGAPITLANGSNNTARAMAAPVFDYFFFGVDWVTGSGGSVGETIDMKAVAACLNLLDIPNVI